MAESITVDTSTLYQTIRGWSANAQAGHDFNALTETEQYPCTTFANYKDDLFAAMLDVGFNRFRVEVCLSDVNNVGSYSSGPNPNAIRPSTATAGQWHYDSMTRVMDSVVEPYRALYEAAFPGETIYTNLCIVDFRDGGYDAENDPNEYAFFVNRFVQEWYDRYGYRPSAIESILEPDTGQNVTNWTRQKQAANIVAAKGLLDSNGHTGIEWLAPSVTDGSITRSWYNDMVAAQPTIPDILSELSYHNYTTPSDAELANIKTAAEADGLVPSMLEHIGCSYPALHNALKRAHVGAWQQFTLAFPASFTTDDGSTYFQVNTTTWAVTLGERTKYFRHYFKYIKRGAQMCATTNSNATYEGTAFINPDGDVVVVGHCGASGDINIVDLPAGTYSIRYTTGNGTSAPSAYDQALSDQVITLGQNVSFNMPAAGVFTVFQTAEPAPTPATYYADPAGTPGGDGSYEDPWNLQTLLDFEPDVNHELIVKDGTYTGKFVSARTAGNFHMEHRVPGSVTIDGYVFSTLVGGIDDNDTSLTLADATGFFVHTDELCIDQEVLKGGTFTGNTLNGISVRGASGTVGGAKSHSNGAIVSMVGDAFYMTGDSSDTRYDFTGCHVMFSDTRRLKDDISGLTRGAGINDLGKRNIIINPYVHDCGVGVFTHADSEDTTLEGAISCHNGVYAASGDGDGHGFYLENSGTFIKIHNCISLNNFNLGMQGYGASPSSSFKGGDLLNSIFANNGSPLGVVDATIRNFNLIIGPDSVQSDTAVVDRCHFFHPHDLNGSNIQIGYGAGVADATFTDSYVIGGANGFEARDVSDTMVLTVDGITIYTRYVGAQYTISKANGYTWNNNTYPDANGRTVFGITGVGLYNLADWKANTGFDAASTETSSHLADTAVVNPPGPNGGYANIVTYTPIKALSASGIADIDIDITDAGLEHGQAYDLRNAFDFLGDIVQSGIYDENNPVITVHLTGAIQNVVEPIGLGYTPMTTALDCSVLVVIPGSTDNEVPMPYSFAGPGAKRLFLMS